MQVCSFARFKEAAALSNRELPPWAPIVDDPAARAKTNLPTSIINAAIL